ncbi:MAG: 16S rRNA (cytidine(1402)-2'-O)-methyltransferase, partial [Trebonia sp.]
MGQTSLTGVLTLAAVPIGRTEDAAPRLAEELAKAHVIAAEDTRRVRRLAASLNVNLTGRIVSYYDVIEARRATELVTELKAGRDVLVVTDA